MSLQRTAVWEDRHAAVHSWQLREREWTTFSDLLRHSPLLCYPAHVALPVMVLESTIVCVDNSEWMRNGDFPPSRLVRLLATP